MTSNASKALKLETDSLAGAEANFEAAKGTTFRGTLWHEARDDEGDRLRALLASNRVFDREKLKSLPANRRIALYGYERRFLFGKRATGVAIASVLSPLDHYAAGGTAEAPPIDLGPLSEHVRRLTKDARVPHLIGVFSPTGFSEDARNAKLDVPNVTVVLIEPNEGGGWRTWATGDKTDSRLLKIFDPERSKEKVDRVRRHVAQHGAELLTGSLSVSSVASSIRLPEDVVRQGFREVADEDPELRVTEKDGEFLLFRGAPALAQEKRSMSVVDRIKQLFSSEGEEAEKINLLAEGRAALAQRRDRIYSDIGKLEEQEAEMLAKGKAATSPVPRRRLAAQLVQLRKDINRQNATASMLNKQVDIISTDIHNLTLIQQGEMGRLPDTEELTENAVKAEEMLETLKANSELVGSLETGIEETLTSDEEFAILEEFEGVNKTLAEPERTASAEAAPEPKAAAPPTAEPVPEDPPPAGEESTRRADAEPTE